MALTSPGVEVTIIDQSQYLPAATGSVPLVVLATAQNKANPSGTGVAAATTAANAGKLYQVTSQRDLVTLYGTPFFYTTTNGTPIQGYELNEYGLLAAYSVLGITNRCYVLRADIDLASLVGQTGRPTGAPANGDWWLDTTTTDWGIFEFNATTGQFTQRTPIVITDSTYISGNLPVASLGNIGDYAVNAIEITDFPSEGSPKQYFYKDPNNNWVALGSIDWLNAWPTVQTPANPTLVAGTLNINVDGDYTTTITITLGDTVQDIADAINNLGWTYLSATVISGKLSIYSKQFAGDITSSNKYISFTASSASVLTPLGITSGFNYYQPKCSYGTSAQMPLWTTGQTFAHPTGSVWLKIGQAGTGFNPVVSQYNAVTARWVTKTPTLATTDWTATNSLDSSGGQAIPANTIYGQYNYDNQYTRYGVAPNYIWRRAQTGPTVAVGTNTSPLFDAAPNGSSYTALVYTTIPNSGISSAYTLIVPDGADATDFVTAWSAAGVPYTSASVTTTGAIQITHTEGGEILIDDTVYTGTATEVGFSSGLMEEAGFVPMSTDYVKYGTSSYITYHPTQTSTSGSGVDLEPAIVTQYGVFNVLPTTFENAGTGYAIGDTVLFPGTELGGTSPANDLTVMVASVNGSGGVTGLTYIDGVGVPLATVQISNWVTCEYTSNEGAPVADPANNTNWFYSVVDQVDIMVNTSNGWRGYKNVNYDSNGFPSPTGSNTTDPNGPIVSATAPTLQSDGTSLVYGDIWIDTSDLEVYPIISRWQQVGTENMWVLIDNTDQTSSTGVLFADARWAPNGTTNPANDPIPTITSLLTSNYLDLDAPSNTLYPTGMLLFNTRRSGYNVKQFRVNYFNSISFPDQSLPAEANAWVSVSGNQSNGSPYMGRQAQRIMVVESLRSVIDTNTDIRDEDNFFNLMATPNYPELQPNMVVLNADRGETGYILGDTPMGLPDQATDLQAWATNAAGATSTGEEGCVTRNTYLGLFYPSGLAADLSGNLVAVPPSHMMLRTFVKNDTVAYPWFAAAGTRRGIIDNATNIGYLDRTTGEFVTIKTRLGVRDVLYTNFINPLVFFTGNGLLNYGNKTSYNSQSALDRTNVARLIAYIRRQLTIAARPFVFEPNDSITRQQIAGVMESLMIDLVAKRGIYDYLVICDESNNTPARIDRNELWVDVAIEPVKAAEFIYIPVRVLNTGELAAI